MNITAIRLVFVRTSTGFIATYKILSVVVMVFECVHVNSTLLSHDSLPLVLISSKKVHKPNFLDNRCPLCSKTFLSAIVAPNSRVN